MKKILAVLLSALLVSSCAAFSISASAYESPNIGGDSDSDGNNDGDDGNGGRNKPGEGDDSDSDSGSSSGSGSSSSTSSTSPKTGAPVSYGVLMAAAALAFGGVAFTSKKKFKEE